MTTADICIASHAKDPDRPRRALDGRYLCHGHRADLEQLVAEMPALHDDLDRPRTPGPKSYGGGGESYGLTIDHAAADLRRAMAGTLASWCRVVSEDRGVHPPASPAIHHTAPWLVNDRAGHLDWCAANRWVDQMLDELRELRRNARGMIDLPARRVDLGSQCLTHADGQRCAGTVVLVIRGDDWHAHCPVCGQRQDVGPYLRTLNRPGAWISQHGVIRLARARGFACSAEVVRQWHHRRKITGRQGASGIEYELDSVQGYLARRQAERERIAS